jgi:hypothetical protein
MKKKNVCIFVIISPLKGALNKSDFPSSKDDLHKV